MTDPADDLLVARAQQGNTEALGALFDQHYPNVVRFLLGHLGDIALAEDLAGEVFARLITRLPQYRAMGVPFRAWLFRIAHNLMIDHYRKHNGRIPVPLDDLEHQPQTEQVDPAQLIEHTLNFARVAQALQRLDPNQKDVVTLRFLSGLSLRETAHTLNKSEAAVKALQHRGLAALRQVLTTAPERVEP